MRFALLAFLAGCASLRASEDGAVAQPAEAASTTSVLLASDVVWEALNPARGDQSPQAGTLWGDRGGEVPTGFLARFVDGFSSPPHIHNATYRAVVISGLVHNDDPDAGKMWMPPGSFWTQPEGESHITASQGVSVALVEIDQGPYLVRPPEEAFDNGERPVNVDASNVVWVSPPGWSGPDGPRVAWLWGSPEETGQSYGAFVKLPAGFSGSLRSHGGTLRAVAITGSTVLTEGDTDHVLTPGSTLTSTGAVAHALASDAELESIFYVRADDRIDLVAQ